MLTISKVTQKRLPGRGINTSTQGASQVEPKDINSQIKAERALC